MADTKTRPPGPGAGDRQKPRINMANIGNGAGASRQRAMKRAGGPQIVLPSRSSSPATGSTGNQSSMPTTGIPGTADGPPIDSSAGSDSPRMGPLAQSIRDQENAAGKGRPQLNMSNSRFGSLAGGGEAGASPSLKEKLGNFGGSVRDALQSKENSGGLYKPGNSQRKQQNTVARFKGMRKKYAVAAILAGTVGGGGAAALGGVATGPLQYIHWAKWAEQHIMDDNSDQGAARTWTLARNLYYFGKGTPEKSRLGLMTTAYLDGYNGKGGIVGKINASGVSYDYNKTTGLFRGHIFDPAKMPTTGVYAALPLEERSPEQVKAFIERENPGVKATIDKGLVKVSSLQEGYTYKKDLKLTKMITRGAGIKTSVAIASRIMAVRKGLQGKVLHPMSAAKRKLSTAAEKRAARIEFRKEKALLESGAQTGVGGKATAEEKDGKATEAEKPAGEVNEIVEEAKATRTATILERLNNPAAESKALLKFQASFKAKFLGVGATVVGALCILQAFLNAKDDLQRSGIIDPMIKIGVGSMAVGNQYADNSKDLDTTQAGWEQEFMFDENVRKGFLDNELYRAANGQTGGTKIPEEVKLNEEGNWLTRLGAALPDLLTPVCEFAGTFAGATVFFGVSLLLGGPVVKTLVQTLLFSALFAFALPILAKMVVGVPVDVLKEGPVRGIYAFLGVGHGANDTGSAWGALPVAPADEDVVHGITASLNQEEFQTKSLAYRLFDAEDPQSLFAQVIDKQQPDPQANVAMMASGLLNIGKTFGSILGKPVLSMVGAAPSRNNFGFARYMFTKEEMDDPRYQMPDINETRVVALLNSEKGPTYVERVKACFGVTIEKKVYDDIPTANPADAAKPAWGVAPPVEGSSPLLKDIQKPSNFCYGETRPNATYNSPLFGPTDYNWLDIRFWIFDSSMANGLVCPLGNTQACIDSGMRSSNSAPAAEPDPSTAL